MRYKIWNKTDTLITPIGEVLTAAQVIAKYPMAAPALGLDFVIADSPITLGVFMEFISLKTTYKPIIINMASLATMTAAEIATLETQYDNETQNGILELISYFEANQPEPEATPEERTAAALEFQNLLALPDVTI